MNCRSHHEHLSDYVEDSLSPALRRDVALHLETCPDCRELAASLEEVVRLLASRPVPEAPSNLTERILERTRPVLRAAWGAAAVVEPEPSSFFRSASSGLAAAAVLATILFVRPPEFLAGWSRSLSLTAHQGYGLGVRAYYRTARWIEDLNVLRITVGVAFEDRLDRLSERLRDLEDARRRTGDDDESSRSDGAPRGRQPLSANVITIRSHS